MNMSHDHSVSNGIDGEPKARGGFTLVEVLVSTVVVMITLAGAIALFIAYRNAWVSATLARNTSNEVSFGLERIVYGVGTNSGLRAAGQASVGMTFPAGGWRINYQTNRFLFYNPGAQTIVDENNEVLCEGILESTAELTNNGCAISITVAESGGGHYATNTMSSFVQFRN